ncbi:putative immunity protein [Streptomyces sp. NPDC056653]|uniref:putative immunity protein n=1 Tax=Streptomyces sp. NPDC056653 TaxID=3345894 RepID=UPI003683A32D
MLRPRSVVTVKKDGREDQRIMAAWAADCAERVLPLFERVHPEGEQPRMAIKACREWVTTGVFRMADIRGASLGAHAAARAAKANDATCFAARAAGQAVAAAHVPQHAFGGCLLRTQSSLPGLNASGKRNSCPSA